MLNLVQLSTNHATLADLDSLLYSFVYEMHNHNPLTIILCMLTLKEKIFTFFPLVGFLSFLFCPCTRNVQSAGPSPVGVCILTTMHGFYPFTHTHTQNEKSMKEKISGGRRKQQKKTISMMNIFLGPFGEDSPSRSSGRVKISLVFIL